VKLEIEKNSIAAIRQRSDHVRSFGREQAAANLEAADGAAKRIRESRRALPGVDVERD
jgi:hypothetical protein